MLPPKMGGEYKNNILKDLRTVINTPKAVLSRYDNQRLISSASPTQMFKTVDTQVKIPKRKHLGIKRASAL